MNASAPPTPGSTTPPGTGSRPRPFSLWIACFALGAITLLTMLSGFARGSGVALLAVVCNLALLAGLWCGSKWAYALTMAFSLAGVLVAFGKGAPQGLAVLLGNSFVVIPVLISTPFFFPRTNRDFPLLHPKSPDAPAGTRLP